MEGVRSCSVVLSLVVFLASKANCQSSTICYTQLDCNLEEFADSGVEDPFNICCVLNSFSSFTDLDGTCQNCDEVEVIQFSSTSFTVDEGDGFVSLFIERTGNTSQERVVRVTLRDIPNSAEGGVDYGPFQTSELTITLLLLSGESQLPFGVQIREDNIVEPPESFTASISGPIPPGVRVGGNNMAVVDIVDNDFVDISISLFNNDSSVVLSENDTEVMFLVSKIGEAVRDVRVTVQTQPLTATQGLDYVGFIQELIFEPEDVEMVVTVTVNDDPIVEDTEEFQVALAPSEGESGVRLTALVNVSTVLIEDEGDALVLQFGSPEYTVSESDGMVEVDILKTGANERQVFVTLTATPDSADESDFNLTQSLLTIEPSLLPLSLSVAVEVFQEGLLEGDTEEVILSLFPSEDEEGAIIEGIETATVVVLDSDEVTIGFTQSGNLTVNEASQALNVSLALQEGTLTAPVSVSVVAVTDGLAEDGEDFQLGETSFTFSPGEPFVQTIQVDIVDDSFFEGREGFTLELITDHPRVNLAPSDIEILIVDNEDLDVLFSESVYEANETDAFVEIQLILNADLQRDIQLDLISQDGRARADEDYLAIRETLTFSPSETTNMVRVNFLDDDISEGSEDFTLQLVLVDEQLGTPGVIAETTILLLDNENIFISFSSSGYTVREDQRFIAVEIVKSGVTQQNLFVNINIVNGTARGGVGGDYGPFPNSFLRFPVLLLAEEDSTRFGLIVIDDEIVEATEEFFSVSLSLDSPELGAGSNVFLEDPSEAVITIIDNDRINVTITPEVVTVTEADTVLVFNVSRNDDLRLDRPVVIEVLDSQGQSEQRMEFVQGGETDFQFNVTLRDNETAEGDRILFVNLSAPTGEVGVVFEENLAVINILDDDVADVEFALNYFEFREFSTNNQICLTKTKDTAKPFTVMVQPIETTPDPPNTFQAQASDDFNPAALNLTFEPESSMECVSMEIYTDEIAEGREVFAVTFSLPQASFLKAGQTALATVEISDVPDVIFGFERTELEVGEDSGVFQLCVSIFNPAGDQPLRTTLDAEIVSSPGTATELDFSAISTLVSFNERTRRQCVDVEIIEDTIFEVPQLQTFSVQIASFRFSNESLVVVASPNSTTVAIVDNDRDVEIGFEGDVSDLSYIESVGEIEFCVRVFQPNVSEVVGSQINYVRVIVNTVPGTADRDMDFSSMSSPAAFFLGTATERACFRVSIINDQEFEGNEPETFTILLTAEVVNTSNIRRVSVDPDVASISIIEDDPPIVVVVGYTQTQFSVVENVSSVELCVAVMEGEVMSPFQVRAIGFSGTAVFGVDFSLDDVVLSFSPDNSDAPQCFPVTIINDDQFEAEETFTVELLLLATPENVEFSSSVATISIEDDDDIVVTSTTPSPTPTVMPTPSPFPPPVNDSVIGDPLYTVPFNLVSGSEVLPGEARQSIPHLCYEIHGEQDRHFNLVSDTCTNVNAFYVAAQSPQLQGWNVIGAIGVRAVNLVGDCVNIGVSTENECTPIVTVDGQSSMTGTRFSSAGVSVSKMRNYVRVSVPNCENIRLVMWITCQNASGYPMIRFDIARGLNLRPTSHGLVGQFWNVPMSIERYEYRGEIADPAFDVDQLYAITVTPVESPARRFVAEFYPYPWEATRNDVCFYAGNIQGGELREIEDDESFNDPVIEGDYTDYIVEGLFEHDFQYSQFEVEMCR